MALYSVYAHYYASKFVGEYEAESEDDAVEMAEKTGAYHASLCHQCSDEIDLGDCWKVEAEKHT